MRYKNLKFFILLTLLAGCQSMQLASRPKTINGETCMQSPNLQVFQVLDNGILAHLCPVDYPSYYSDAFEACTLKGDLVFMAVPQKANDYADNQKVTLTKTQCFVGAGTYSYPRKDGVQATVRNIKILEEANPADGTKKTQ